MQAGIAMTRDELYHDFLLIKKLYSPNHVKVRLLTSLLEQDGEAWKIVGITKPALEKFAENDFKYRPFMKINRAHIIDRNVTYTIMLETDICQDEWWDLFQKNDKTVLATSDQDISDYIPLDLTGELFKRSGYRWRHTNQERLFLRDLYQKLERGS